MLSPTWQTPCHSIRKQHFFSLGDNRYIIHILHTYIPIAHLIKQWYNISLCYVYASEKCEAQYCSEQLLAWHTHMMPEPSDDISGKDKECQSFSFFCLIIKQEVGYTCVTVGVEDVSLGRLSLCKNTRLLRDWSHWWCSQQQICFSLPHMACFILLCRWFLWHKNQDIMHWESCDVVFQAICLPSNISDYYSLKHFIMDSCLKYLFCVHLFAFLYISTCPIEVCIGLFNLCSTQAKTIRAI